MELEKRLAGIDFSGLSKVRKSLREDLQHNRSDELDFEDLEQIAAAGDSHKEKPKAKNIF